MFVVNLRLLFYQTYSSYEKTIYRVVNTWWKRLPRCLMSIQQDRKMASKKTRFF